MKHSRKTIIIFTAIILSVTTYWSLSYASENRDHANGQDTELTAETREVFQPQEEVEQEDSLITEDTDRTAPDLNETSESGDSTTEETETTDESDEADRYISKLFLEKGVGLRDTKDELVNTLGQPSESGMYEGGYFFDYGDMTYFVNPETELIVAMAMPGDLVNADAWKIVEETIQENIVLEGMNEMDGVWMEIYDWHEYDLMIERENEGADPHYIWLMEDKLFTE